MQDCEEQLLAMFRKCDDDGKWLIMESAKIALEHTSHRVISMEGWCSDHVQQQD